MNIGKLRSWHLVHHFMQIEAGKEEAVTDFIILGSKITVDDDCSHEIKRRLLLKRKAMTNLLLLSCLSRVLTLCHPIDGSPPGFSVPVILQARILESVAISFSNDKRRQHIKK